MESGYRDASKRPNAVETTKTPGQRRRLWIWRLSLGAALALAALVSFGLSGRPATDRSFNPEVVRVKRRDVFKTLVVEGNVESSQNIEIKCRVPGGSTLLWLVDDGAQVKQGDELVRLDTSLVDEQLAEQTILVEQARATLIAAERSLSAADISIEEYRDGIYLQTRQELELNVLLAGHQRGQAEGSLAQARRLARRGFINPVQLTGETAAVESARLDLSIARRALDVLENYTRPKTLQELQSLRDAAEASLRAAQATFQLERKRLQQLEKQRAGCLIRAPRDGLAVHANDPSIASETLQIELGARVRQRQTIIWLPDLSQMQVRVLVHESQISYLQPGARALVRVQDHEFAGQVSTIANQPERTRSSQRHLKYYATTIRIDDPSSTLRPGQSAEVEILLARHDNVLTVPVTAVVQQGDDVFAWVQTDSALERREVALGTVTDQVAEVSAGLHEDDEVLSRPRVDAAALVPEYEPRARIDVAERFGVATVADEPERSPTIARCRQRPAEASTGGG